MKGRKDVWDCFEEIHLHMSTVYPSMQCIRLPSKARYIFADHTEIVMSRIDGVIFVSYVGGKHHVVKDTIIDKQDFIIFLKQVFDAKGKDAASICSLQKYPQE